MHNLFEIKFDSVFNHFNADFIRIDQKHRIFSLVLCIYFTIMIP